MRRFMPDFAHLNQLASPMLIQDLGADGSEDGWKFESLRDEPYRTIGRTALETLLKWPRIRTRVRGVVHPECNLNRECKIAQLGKVPPGVPRMPGPSALPFRRLSLLLQPVLNAVLFQLGRIPRATGDPRFQPDPERSIHDRSDQLGTRGPKAQPLQDSAFDDHAGPELCRPRSASRGIG
jgi:hypothetical protein